jgi:integrase
MAGRRRGAGEGSIFQRKDGRWVGQLDLGVVSGRRRFRSVYGKQRRDVAERLTQLLRERDTGTLPAAGKLTVGDYLTSWLSSRRSRLRPATRRGYGWLLQRHVLPEIGAVRLEKLTPADVRRMLQRRLDAGLSPRSVHHVRAVLRAALSQAVKDGLGRATLRSWSRARHSTRARSPR